MGQSFRAQATAQSSQAGTADTLVTAGQTVLDLLASGNAEGAYTLHFELDVTVAPSTATFVECYIEESHDDTTYSAPRLIRSWRGITTSADRYAIAIDVSSPYVKVSWKPIGFGLTATVRVRPSYPA